MNAWLLRAPWWKLAVVMGLLLAPFSVLLLRSTGDRSWTAAALLGVSVAIVCAPVLGFMSANGVRDSMAAVEEVPEDERALVERAARRGSVPQDDRQRAAALRLVEDRLLILRGTRARALAFLAVLTLTSGFFAVAQSPWCWFAAAASLALAALVLIAPARLERRAELLRRNDR